MLINQIKMILPVEIITLCALEHVNIWRALWSSCKQIYKAMQPLTPRAKSAFAKYCRVQHKFALREWWVLPNGYRHGRWKGIYQLLNGIEERVIHYKDDRIWGECEVRWNGKLQRKWSMYESKVDGEWQQWNTSTGELEGWVLLSRGKVIKVYKWIYGRWDHDTKKIIVGDPIDSEFVM
ncbi:Hypothetical protein FSTVST1_437 [Faustovirus ST1]|nr:Hypothetical protein FSTVST1_437 [Faustovirus ST1]